MTQTIFYDSGRCGDGKTYSYLRHIAANKGCYIIAFDRVDIMKQRAAELEAMSMKPTIITINEKARHGFKSVVEAIENIPNDYTTDGTHFVIMITHQSMLCSRFSSAFSDWELVIDEDFSIFQSAQWNTGSRLTHFHDQFQHQPTDDPSLYRISRSQSQRITAYAADDTISDAVKDFRRLVERQDVFSYSNDPDSFSWWSVWSFEELKHFKRVTILANAYPEKLSFKIGSIVQNVKFVPHHRPTTRHWTSRPVTIRYFSEESGSRTYFESDVGQRNLSRIARWSRNAASPLTYSSKNSYIEDNLGGTEIKPLSTGRNDLQTYDRGVFVYSAQASNDEVVLLERMTDGKITRQDIKRDRELEAIAQFALRGTLRNPTHQGTFELCLFSKEQAEETADFLVRNGYVTSEDIRLEFVDLKLEAKPVKPNGRPKMVLSTEEKAARTKEQNRLRAKAARAKRKGAL
ncbi:hypothetical protein [Brevundimonas sp.]|uniref:hypothetical protein n=1 Tax=Brevundimonas sp. TaxID=1871086 RepID=UPI002FCA95BD